MGTVRIFPGKEVERSRGRQIKADAVLVRRASGGDRDAFQAIVEAHKQRMFSVARSVLGDLDAAEDVVQEAFIKAYKALPGFRAESLLSTWLYRITYSAAIDHLRQQARHIELATQSTDVESVSDTDPATLSDNAVNSRQLQREINAALAALSPFERTVFSLRHLQNFKLKDIAVVVDRSEGTVKNILFRAIHKLRDRLVQSQIDIAEIEHVKL